MKHKISESLQNQTKPIATRLGSHLTLESDLTSSITIHQLPSREHLAVKAPPSLTILTYPKSQWTRALTETPDLWGGKLKHLETPTRNRILDTALSQSAHSAARNGPIASSTFHCQMAFVMKESDLAADLERKFGSMDVSDGHRSRFPKR